MATPLESPIIFTNVGKARWWRSGIFASQTGYVLLALVALFVVMNFASPYFLTEGNMQNVAKNFSFIAIATPVLGSSLVISGDRLAPMVAEQAAASCPICILHGQRYHVRDLGAEPPARRVPT